MRSSSNSNNNNNRNSNIKSNNKSTSGCGGGGGAVVQGDLLARVQFIDHIKNAISFQLSRGSAWKIGSILQTYSDMARLCRWQEWQTGSLYMMCIFVHAGSSARLVCMRPVARCRCHSVLAT